MPMMPPTHRRRIRTTGKQDGLATLVVVLVLLLVVTLVAGYTSRNLIFEQRTGVNQYRATQALEAADAGQEWALALLNGGRLNADCRPSTDTTDGTFRQRYLSIAPTGGLITPVVLGPVVAAQDASPTPTCVFDPQADPGSGQPWWRCRCPTGATVGLTLPTSDEVSPAYRVRLQRIREPGGTERDQPGVIRIESIACTRFDNDCLAFHTASLAQGSEGRAYTSSIAALTGNAANLPLAPLVARGAVAWPGLTLANVASSTTGLTLQTGGAFDDSGVTRRTLPGTPVGTSWLQDTDLAALTSDRLFASVFRTWPDTFRSQPAARVLSGCSGGLCSAAAVRAELAARPGSPVWVDGDLVIDSPGDIGAADAPALVVVTGQVSATQSGVTFWGLLYVRQSGAGPFTWTPSGSFNINGAVVVDGSVLGSGSTNIVYDASVLERLRVSVGSFVRLPGSWRDLSLQ